MTPRAKATPLTRQLKKMGACPEAVTWAADYPDLASAWAACPRAEWLLWFYGRLPDMDRKRLVLAACACAETVLPIYEKKHPGDDRPRKAIETARAWARGEATIGEVRAAAYAAYAADAAADAADAADADAYADAAYADAYADAAVYAAADAAADAADAAYAAAYADAAAYAAAAADAAADAAAADAYAARFTSPATLADLVRGIIPDPEAA